MTISLDCNDVYSKCHCERSQCYEIIIVPRTSVSYDGNPSLPCNLSWGAGYCGQDRVGGSSAEGAFRFGAPVIGAFVENEV
ncbi:hypothetical protein L208DRAFT_1399622 [Tricholoma matsutake]|nr:hypothetical protein L208DRAFT_1399622 [Tricholoma matsutake 945]